MNWIDLEKGVALDWDTVSDEARVLFNEDESGLEDSEIADLIEKAIGRKCEVGSWDAVNEGKNEAIASVYWKELTPAQKFELLGLVQQTAKQFVEEFNEPLDSSETDW